MDLYALPPGEFTGARDAAVRQARESGDRVLAAQLAALRRPTASAGAVNALVRREPELVRQLLELGEQLGRAQAGGSGEVLRELGEQRRQLVEAVADRAGAAAGGALSATVRAEVTGTLEAAMADAASADAVLSGRLVRPLSYAGFGAADPTAAVAGPVPAGGPTGSARPRAAAAPGRDDRESTPDPRAAVAPGRDDRESAPDPRAAAEHRARKTRQRQRVARADRAALEAAAALDDAVALAASAAAGRAGAAEQARVAGGQVQRLEEELDRARDARTRAGALLEAADRESDRTRRQVASAQRAAERARAVLTTARAAGPGAQVRAAGPGMPAGPPGPGPTPRPGLVD